MMDRAIEVMHEDPRVDWRNWRALLLVPPILTLAYPFLLEGFHASVSAVLSGAGGVAAWSAAAITLILAFAAPILALMIAISLAAIDLPTAAQRKAKYIALLAVAAPPIFVF